MSGLRPTIWNVKYNDLSTSERMIQAERDGLLWDQAEALKKLNETQNLQTNGTTTSSGGSTDYRYMFNNEWYKYVPEKLRNKFYELDNSSYLTEKIGDIAYAEFRLNIKQAEYSEERLKYLKSASAVEWTFIGIIWTIISLLFTFSIGDMNFLLAFAVIIGVNLYFVLSHMQNVHKAKLEQIYYKDQLTKIKKDKDAILKEIRVAVEKIR